MRYICYINKQRVDSLYEDAFDGLVNGSVERRTQEKLKEGSIGILQLLKAGLTFGRKEATSAEKHKRITAVSRLNSVIDYLEREATIGDLESDISEKGKLDCDWYTVATEFSVPKWERESRAVYLVANIHQCELRLSCDKANFSGTHREGDEYISSSTNRFLFEGEVALPMSGLIRVVPVDLDLKKRLIRGAPLYLVLNPLNKDLGQFDEVEV